MNDPVADEIRHLHSIFTMTDEQFHAMRKQERLPAHIRRLKPWSWKRLLFLEQRKAARSLMTEAARKAL